MSSLFNDLSESPIGIENNPWLRMAERPELEKAFFDALSNNSQSPSKAFYQPDSPFRDQVKVGWKPVAIVVGVVAMGVFALGATCLLNAYGYISLPKEMTSLIGVIGSSPYNWKLWAVTASSLLTGFIMIGSPARKLQRQKNFVNNFEYVYKRYCEQLTPEREFNGKLKIELKSAEYAIVEDKETKARKIIVKHGNDLKETPTFEPKFNIEKNQYEYPQLDIQAKFLRAQGFKSAYIPSNKYAN